MILTSQRMSECCCEWGGGYLGDRCRCDKSVVVLSSIQIWLFIHGVPKSKPLDNAVSQKGKEV